MRQQLLDFPQEEKNKPGIKLNARAREEIVTLMAAVIVAVHRKGVKQSDEKPSDAQQDQT